MLCALAMRILIVEDDPELSRSLARCLTAACYATDQAADGVSGLYLARLNQYDLIISDYVMPKKDGLALCDELRALGNTTPILILSVKGTIPDKVVLLNHGADDYLAKPFSYEELTARVRALLRRPRIAQSNVITVGDVTIDSSRQIVKCGAKDVYLTRKEYSLLEYLACQQGAVVSRSMLMEHVWNMERDLFSNTIEAHILNLRKKLNARSSQTVIQTVPGRGYRLECA